VRLLSRLIVPVGAIAVMAVGTGLVLADRSASPGATTAATKFNPKQLAGKWVGQWRNSTFGSTGAVRGNVKKKGKRMKVLWDIDGTALGCADPPENKTVLKKGRGANRWNGRKFKAVDKSDTFGKVTFNYKRRNNKVTGSGGPGGLPCSADKTYTFDGKLTNKKLNLDIDIKSNGAPFAKSTMSVGKQQ